MYLKSITGEVLFEGRFNTVRQALEQAVNDNVVLSSVDLRQANLVGAELDNARLSQACLWGASLRKANITGVQLREIDCRNVDMTDCCLSESDCYGADFSGSYFSCTIFRETNLESAQFSCPSLFGQNLTEVESLKNAIYKHKGEVCCDLSCVPITISGLSKRVVLMKEQILIGDSLHDIHFYSDFCSSFLKFIDQEKRLKFKTFK